MALQTTADPIVSSPCAPGTRVPLPGAEREFIGNCNTDTEHRKTLVNNDNV